MPAGQRNRRTRSINILDFCDLSHVAGTTVGTTIRRAECALQNVNRIAEGLEPQWRVDHL